MIQCFTDKWPVLLDNDGKPLIGRVKFYDAGTTNYKTIYADEAKQTALPNPNYTDVGGKLQGQIFLDYGAYTCVVEKFLGEDQDTMLDYEDDVDMWETVKTFYLDGGDSTNALDDDAERGYVGTIAELRDIDPTAYNVVQVVGYYTKNDYIATRTYVWGATGTENYGSIIATNTDAIGAWHLCEDEELLSTTFGIIPGSSITYAERTARMTALAAYANGSSVVNRVTFPTGTYVFTSGNTFTLNKELHFHNGVVFNGDVGDITLNLNGGFSASENAAGVFSSNARVYFDNGQYIKASWFLNRANFIDDNKSKKNIHLLLDAYSTIPDNASFSCWTFESNGTKNATIANLTLTFTDCRFVGPLFTGSPLSVTFDSCGCLYASQVMGTFNLNRTNSDSEAVVALNGTTIVADIKVWINTGASSTVVLDMSGIEVRNGVENAGTSNALLQNYSRMHPLQFEGAIVAYYSDGVNCTDYKNDSDIENVVLAFPNDTFNLHGRTLTWTGQDKTFTVKVKNGTVKWNDDAFDSSNPSDPKYGLEAENCTIDSESGTLNAKMALAILKNCNVECSIRLSEKNSSYVNDFTGCTFEKAVFVYGDTMYTRAVDCRFETSLHLVGTASVSGQNNFAGIIKDCYFATRLTMNANDGSTASDLTEFALSSGWTIEDNYGSGAPKTEKKIALTNPAMVYANNGADYDDGSSLSADTFAAGIVLPGTNDIELEVIVQYQGTTRVAPIYEKIYHFVYTGVTDSLTWTPQTASPYQMILPPNPGTWGKFFVDNSGLNNDLTIRSACVVVKKKVY